MYYVYSTNSCVGLIDEEILYKSSSYADAINYTMNLIDKLQEEHNCKGYYRQIGEEPNVNFDYGSHSHFLAIRYKA
jgi:hypothetical protein